VVSHMGSTLWGIESCSWWWTTDTKILTLNGEMLMSQV
jgi:hypothetical protein